MPSKNTDWKKERAKLQQTSGEADHPAGDPTYTEGRTILKKGRTTSIGNDGAFPAAQSLDDRLRMMEANRTMYQQMRALKKKAVDTRSIHDRLKGLFGGGE